MMVKRAIANLSISIILLGLTEQAAFTQTHTIISPRPIAEIIDMISRKYKVPVSYEDTSYNSSVDLSPPTNVNFQGVEQFPDLANQRVILKNVIASSPAVGNTISKDISTALEEYNKGRGYEAFSVSRDSAGVHVISRNTLSERGNVSQLVPILDTQISLNQQNKSATYAVLSLQSQLRLKNVNMLIGDLPWNTFSKNVSLSLTNVSARQALETILASIHYQGTWRLLCGPISDGCALNLVPY